MAWSCTGAPRGGDDDVRRFVFATAVSGRVADRAIVRDAIKTDSFLGKAYRDFVAFLPDDAKRFVTAWAGHEIGKNRGNTSQR